MRKGKALSPDSRCQAAEKRWAPAVRLSMPLKLRLSTRPALAAPLSRLSNQRRSLFRLRRSPRGRVCTRPAKCCR
ncbi:hypothetical protein D3C81_2077930 [compost metagenome]